ncbi:MAG: hypothetical protein ACRD4D_07375 [Candidatus Acidiferrales bacterium]
MFFAALSAAAVLAACSGPIVARSPEALFALAQEQIGNSNYYPAADTLARVAREAPKTDLGRRARLQRITLLAGMARAFRDIAEAYLEGHQHAGAAAYSGQMRAIAMDYFGRSRGRSLEMIEALDALLREPLPGPVRLELSLPAFGSGSQTLARVRQGTWVDAAALGPVEKDGLAAGMTESRGALAGDATDASPARIYLGLAREIFELASIYRKEALGDPRLTRLFYERAASAAALAADIAAKSGDRRLEEQSRALVTQCQEMLKKS